MSREPGKRFTKVPKYKMVYEEFAKEQSANDALTLRERLFWLAVWRAKPNGHATFQDGEIAKLLGTTPRSVRRARNDAVQVGQLHEMSDAICLVLPADAVGNKLQGHDRPCPHCMGYTPEAATTLTLRDYESEALERESYRRGMNSQAQAVLEDQIGPLGGQERSAELATTSL